VSGAHSALVWLPLGFPWSTCGDADEKDQGRPDRKNIQAEQGDSQNGRSYIEQGQHRVVQHEKSQKEQTDQSFVFIVILFHGLVWYEIDQSCVKKKSESV